MSVSCPQCGAVASYGIELAHRMGCPARDPLFVHRQPLAFEQPTPMGCICPPTAEQTCQNPGCPRQNHLFAAMPSKAEQDARDDGLQLVPQAAIITGTTFEEVQQRVVIKTALTEAQIKHMVDRFLMWRLPRDFNPDCGISFDNGEAYGARREPVGTNLFSATEADAMVRHMLAEMPGAPAPDDVHIVVSTETYEEVRQRLISCGTGGTILESPKPRRIEMTGVTIVDSQEEAEDKRPEWPPRRSATGLRDGHRRFGSTGQLFEARNGRWVRIKKANEQ